MRTRILEIINDLLMESGKPPIDSLTDSLRLREDLGLDSLMLAELTVKVEDEFQVDLFENGIIVSVGQVLSKVQRTNAE